MPSKAHRQSSSTPYTVVLTGGIASGKTAVSDCFRELGIPVIDTDVIAREVVEPGEPALEQIITVFGAEYLQPDGSLDRKLLKDRVFSEPKARTNLECILHPIIRQQAFKRLVALDSAYCILVVPLFLESNDYDWIDFVLVVDSSDEVRQRRLVDRDEISEELATRIMESQGSRQDRLLIADGIITNNGAIAELKKRVQQFHKQFLINAEHKSKHDQFQFDN